MSALFALLLASAASAQVMPGGTLPPPTPAAPAGSAAPALGTVARPMVTDIIIRGNRHVPAEWIRTQMKTAVGREYDVEVVNRDLMNLYNTKQFGNVLIDRLDDGPGRVKVIVTINDYPSLVQKVTYVGNVHVKTSDLEEITGIRKGMPCNAIANRVAARKIMQKYAEDGWTLANCELDAGGKPGDTEVIFRITEGRKCRIRSLDFSGNKWATSGQLRTHVGSSAKFLGLPIGGVYNADRLNYDMDELQRYYRSFGFHDVRINREIRYSPDAREVDVIVHVHEGVQYKLEGKPQVIGIKSLTPESLEAIVKSKGGEYYNQHTIDGDLAMIKGWVGHQGRETAVQAIPVFSADKPGVVSVSYQVEERPQALVGRIFIAGNDRTKQNVILRQVGLYPGQVLSYPAIKEAERNLARLNIFEATPDGAVRPSITVLDNPGNPDSPYRDILITVQEASTGSLMFGLGVNSDSGLSGSIVLNERNFDLFRLPTSIDDFLNGTAFRGAGQELRIEAVPGTQLQRYVVTFREPFLFDSPYALTTSGFFYQRYFNEYAEDRLGGRFSLGRKLDDFWSVAGTIRLEQVDVHNVASYAPPDYLNVRGSNFLAGFRGSVIRDSRNSVVRATEGSLLDVSYEQVTGDFNFGLASAELTNYFTVLQRADGTGKHVVSFHNQVGWASDQTPVFERYFAGGFRSIRGFAFRGVSPEVTGYKIGGNFMVLNSLEYQLPVRAGDDVNLVAFVDGGMVSPSISKLDDYRVSAGFGVRFVVPMLGPAPIALDFGFPIVKGQYDQTQVFNFFMGWNR